MPAFPDKAHEMFCFAVYEATHAINRTYAPLLKPLGLTYPQYITLTLLWERDGQGVGELAQQVGMQSSTLTPLLKRLEKLGHVTRLRGEHDERQVFVHLTESGRALRAAAKDITRCLVSATNMDRKTLDRLVCDLRVLSRNLQSGLS